MGSTPTFPSSDLYITTSIASWSRDLHSFHRTRKYSRRVPRTSSKLLQTFRAITGWPCQHWGPNYYCQVGYHWCSFSFDIWQLTLFRALGVIAQYIDSDDKDDLVWCFLSWVISDPDFVFRKHSKLFYLPWSKSLDNVLRLAMRTVQGNYSTCWRHFSFLCVLRNLVYVNTAHHTL